MVEKFKYIIMVRQIEYERVIIIPDLKIWCAQEGCLKHSDQIINMACKRFKTNKLLQKIGHSVMKSNQG